MKWHAVGQVNWTGKLSPIRKHTRSVMRSKFCNWCEEKKMLSSPVISFTGRLSTWRPKTH